MHFLSALSPFFSRSEQTLSELSASVCKPIPSHCHTIEYDSISPTEDTGHIDDFPKTASSSTVSSNIPIGNTKTPISLGERIFAYIKVLEKRKAGDLTHSIEEENRFGTPDLLQGIRSIFKIPEFRGILDALIYTVTPASRTIAGSQIRAIGSSLSNLHRWLHNSLDEITLADLNLFVVRCLLHWIESGANQIFITPNVAQLLMYKLFLPENAKVQLLAAGSGLWLSWLPSPDAKTEKQNKFPDINPARIASIIEWCNRIPFQQQRPFARPDWFRSISFQTHSSSVVPISFSKTPPSPSLQ